MRAADETGERVKALALNCREQCALCPVLSPCVTVNRAVYLGFRSIAAGHDLTPTTLTRWRHGFESRWGCHEQQVGSHFVARRPTGGRFANHLANAVGDRRACAGYCCRPDSRCYDRSLERHHRADLTDFQSHLVMPFRRWRGRSSSLSPGSAQPCWISQFPRDRLPGRYG